MVLVCESSKVASVCLTGRFVSVTSLREVRSHLSDVMV